MNAHDVLIVGGGPAGLAAAVMLHSLGIRDVVVLEREQHAGGVPRHCGHVGFGWREFRRLLSGPRYAERLVSAAEGIDVRTGTTALSLGAGGVVHVRTASGPAAVTGRRVLLALGTRETPRAARLVSGTRPWGITTTGALQQMVYLAGVRPFERAVVVGSELVAFSSLLTMRHAGMRAVALLEDGERILAPRPADWIARVAFGTRVLTNTQLVTVHGDARVRAVEIERDGRRELLDCDGVVFSGRFVPEAALVRASHLALDPGTGGPVVDQYGRCSDPAFFAAGNLLRPVEASWTAWSEGGAVARAIAADLKGQLPAAQRHTEVRARGGVKYVCPQRIAWPQPLAPALPLNLRVQREVRGRLCIRADGRESWGEHRHLLPERRVLLPWPELAADAPKAVDVDVG